MHKSMRREEGALSGLKWHTQSRGALWEWRRKPGHSLLAPTANLPFLPSPAPASPPFLGTRHRKDRGVGLDSIQVSCLDPKGIIKIRFNEIRKFSARCLKYPFLGSRISWALWPHKSPIAVSIPLYMLLSFPKAELAAFSAMLPVMLPPGSAPFPQQNQPCGKGLSEARQRESLNLSMRLGECLFLISVNLMMAKGGVKSGTGPPPVVFSGLQPASHCSAGQHNSMASIL